MRLNISSFLQWRINVYIYAHLGWRWAYYYIKILAWLYFGINRRDKAKIRSAVATVFGPHKQRSEIKAIFKKVLRGVVAHYYEKLFNAYCTYETLNAFVHTHIELEGLETIARSLALKKGVLLITGHVGGVELIPAFLGYHQCPVTILAKFKSKHLRRASQRQGRRFQTRIVDADRTPNILRALIDNLKKNRVVITQCDEIDEWRPSRTGCIHFLGKLTALDRTIDVLAKRVDAPIVFGLMHRRQNHHYQFKVASLEQMKTQVTGTAPMSVGAIVLKYLEQYIYNHPDGWYQWKKFESIVPVVAAEGKPLQAPAAGRLKPSLTGVVQSLG
jgi:KDO2-lipid IV(A) lauroyltransferase